jgi:hypothetical protein
MQKNAMAQVANIYIGLGGTGGNCLKTVKQEIYSRIRPDNFCDGIPYYSHLEFLAVDIDSQSVYEDSFNGASIASIKEAEYFNLLYQTIKPAIILKHKELEPALTWFNHEIQFPYGCNGTASVRQIGRLLLMQKSAQFVHRVGQCIQTARAGLPDGSAVYIHIFTGMGGGTGSGTFLDACYLVRKALENMGIGDRATISGYFFLPDVNLSVPGIAANATMSSFIRDNGFAAMKELDYCMSDDSEWNQVYDGFQVHSKQPPVDLAYLISAQTADGMIHTNGYRYAMNVVSEFLVQNINGGILSKMKFAGAAMIPKTSGANYCYTVLGAAKETVPNRKIITYLASKLFHSMADIADQLPSNEQIVAAQETAGLTPKQLLAEMMTKTTFNAQLLDLDYKDVPDLNEADEDTDELHLPPLLVEPYRQAEQKMRNAIMDNRETMERKWSVDTQGSDNGSDSVSCRVYELLKSMILDDTKGPFYAAEVLNGKDRHSLVALLVAFECSLSGRHGILS